MGKSFVSSGMHTTSGSGWGMLDSSTGVCSVILKPAGELVKAGTGASITGSGIWKL